MSQLSSTAHGMTNQVPTKREKSTRLILFQIFLRGVGAWSNATNRYPAIALKHMSSGYLRMVLWESFVGDCVWLQKLDFQCRLTLSMLVGLEDILNLECWKLHFLGTTIGCRQTSLQRLGIKKLSHKTLGSAMTDAPKLWHALSVCLRTALSTPFNHILTFWKPISECERWANNQPGHRSQTPPNRFQASTQHEQTADQQFSQQAKKQKNLAQLRPRTINITVNHKQINQHSITMNDKVYHPPTTGLLTRQTSHQCLSSPNLSDSPLCTCHFEGLGANISIALVKAPDVTNPDPVSSSKKRLSDIQVHHPQQIGARMVFRYLNTAQTHWEIRTHRPTASVAGLWDWSMMCSKTRKPISSAIHGKQCITTIRARIITISLHPVMPYMPLSYRHYALSHWQFTLNIPAQTMRICDMFS